VVEAGIGQVQGEQILPIDPGPDRLSGLAVTQPFAELQEERMMNHPAPEIRADAPQRRLQHRTRPWQRRPLPSIRKQIAEKARAATRMPTSGSPPASRFSLLIDARRLWRRLTVSLLNGT
jgi:hypothetical protein